MSRQEENKILVEKSRDIASNPFVSRSALDAATVRLIWSISKSLAVIADEMADGSGPLFDPDKAKEFLRDNPGKEKDAETESGKTKV